MCVSSAINYANESSGHDDQLRVPAFTKLPPPPPPRNEWFLHAEARFCRVDGIVPHGTEFKTRNTLRFICAWKTVTRLANTVACARRYISLVPDAQVPRCERRAVRGDVVSFRVRLLEAPYCVLPDYPGRRRSSTGKDFMLVLIVVYRQTGQRYLVRIVTMNSR